MSRKSTRKKLAQQAMATRPPSSIPAEVRHLCKLFEERAKAAELKLISPAHVFKGIPPAVAEAFRRTKLLEGRMARLWVVPHHEEYHSGLGQYEDRYWQGRFKPSRPPGWGRPYVPASSPVRPIDRVALPPSFSLIKP
mgnify:CR=1 FL=1